LGKRSQLEASDKLVFFRPRPEWIDTFRSVDMDEMRQRIRRDYTLASKRAVVDEVEPGATGYVVATSPESPDACVGGPLRRHPLF
jgi:hypothetical protein